MLEGGSGRIITDGSGPYAAVRDALLATGGREGDGSAADALAALSGSGPIPAGKRLSDGTPRPVGRAQTMALSDADIEELDELEGNGGESRAADAGWSMPNIRWPGEELDDDEPAPRSASRSIAVPELRPGPGSGDRARPACLRVNGSGAQRRARRWPRAGRARRAWSGR